MFCTNCGNQLPNNARFCPACGKKVSNEEEMGFNSKFSDEKDTLIHTQQEEQQRSSFMAGNDMGGDGKINWKKYLTLENVERYAPVAALIPVAMAVIVCLLGGLYDVFRVIRPIIRILTFVLEVLFILVTIAATVGLTYITVKKKDVSNIYSWLVPAGTFIATVACLGIVFRWGVIAWISGIISVILGLEFTARIAIQNQPIESPFNLPEAFNFYKKYYIEYKAKYVDTKATEKVVSIASENSKFDGTGMELLGYTLLTILVSAITCGIGAPWMICKIYKWKVHHTVINGKRLTFTGTGGSLLGNWILWELLTVVTCGIYSFFAHVALRKWELKHTYIEGEPIIANGNESYFDGGSLAYFGYGLLGTLLLLVTCGLAYPWVMAMIQKWDTSHQVINRRRLIFKGSGLGFLGEYIIIFLLSVITCGIYTPWAFVRMNRYIARNTNFLD